MSTALCPPHKTVHSAIIRISSRSCRPALPVRGSSRPSKQAMNPSMSRLPPTASKTPWVDAIASQHASSNALVKLFQMQFPCGCHPIGLTDRLGLGGGQCLLSRLGAIAGQNADKTGNRHACGNDRLTHLGAQNTVQHHQAAELMLWKTTRR